MSPGADGGKSPRSGIITFAAVSALWIALGLVAGMVDHLTVLRSRGLSFAQAVGGPVLASLIWIPMTFAAAAAARRWPIWTATTPARDVAGNARRTDDVTNHVNVGPTSRPSGMNRTHVFVHLLLSGSASFVLNFLWGFSMAATTGAGRPVSDILATSAFAGIRFIHLNAGVYWVIVVVVTLWIRRQQPARNESEHAWPETLTIRSGTTTHTIPVSDIRWIEGAGDYARVHVTDTRFLAGERLKQLERTLNPAVFARVHRSAIVRLSCIRALNHRSHGDYEVLLDDGTRVRVSRSRRAAIASLLKPDGVVT